MSDREVSDFAKKHDDEIAFSELFAVLWAGKTKIIAVVLITAVVAVSYALYLPNEYTSEAILAPKNNGGAGGVLGQLASQYSGLAGLAGVNVRGAGGQNQEVLAYQMLKTRDFYRDYLYKATVADLMAATGWDHLNQQVIYDKKIYDPATAKWLRSPDSTRAAKPSVQEAHEKFINGALETIEDPVNGFVTVRVTHVSPVVAQRWVTLIIEGINDAIRTKDVVEAQRSIAFLNEQRLKTNLIALTEVFTGLIEEQTKTVMLANASEEYVFQIIEHPVAPELKSGPARGIICVLSVFFAGLFVVLFILIRHFTSKPDIET